MLFHVTATHSVDNCPGYNHEMLPAMIEAIESSDARANEFGIKVHFMVNAAPRHVIYALLEADDASKIAPWANGFPLKQDFDVNPVHADADMAAIARLMMENKKH